MTLMRLRAVFNVADISRRISVKTGRSGSANRFVRVCGPPNAASVRRGSAPIAATARGVAGTAGLALAAQIDRSYLGAVERGESNATLLNMVKIAAALDVTVAELMREARL